MRGSHDESTPIPDTSVQAVPVPGKPVPGTPCLGTPMFANPRTRFFALPGTPMPGTPMPGTPMFANPRTPAPKTPMPGTPMHGTPMRFSGPGTPMPETPMLSPIVADLGDTPKFPGWSLCKYLPSMVANAVFFEQRVEIGTSRLTDGWQKGQRSHNACWQNETSRLEDKIEGFNGFLVELKV